jgi:ribonuclease P protein component
VFEKLGKNPEFQKVYREGRPKANKYLVMYVKTGESGPNRYGFSVSKKVGNSVVRHRITRLLRESVRRHDAFVKTGNRIVIVARKDVKDKSFKEIDGAVFHLLKIHGILK